MRRYEIKYLDQVKAKIYNRENQIGKYYYFKNTSTKIYKHIEE